jgi:hypothetical protein
MTTLPIPHEEQVPVEKESEGAGHDVIPIENAVGPGPRDSAAKPESSFQRALAFARDDQVSQASLERPAKILEAIESFLDYIDASGIAEPNGAIVAEGRAWHDCDIRLA